MRESSFPRRVVDAVLAGFYGLVISDALVSEYRTVFARPHVIRAHRLSGGTADRLLSDIEDFGTVLAPDPSPVAAPDPGDQHLWDILADVADSILVTGDWRLLASGDYAGRVLSPRAFVERYLADA
jgi:predicted nucleic acid-binding protein